MSDRPKNLTVSEALERLKQGNARYTQDATEAPRRCANRREELVGGQQPFATILTCADSRVSPELVFDEGLGDLFVIRVAGNLIDDAVLGSMEYAALHLGVNLTVVMGHRSCGAVGAAVANKDFDGPATHSHIDSLIDAIRPAVVTAAKDGDDDLLERSVRGNAQMVAGQINASDPIMAKLGKEHDVTAAAAYYDLESGQVEFL